ncbi:hypothetical protein C7293_28820 [filamentous cyanobacterium CCT1]|nr:hypothetical protein C7293_28820 [filamentous cyanobacterium CCT1]PSN76523.1 hypothetical protein C8B47_26855 [filamentous cyanobacterium CCP4]
MYNEEETMRLLALKKRLMEESNTIGWLCTVHRNRVHYENNPEASKKIQEQLNQATNLISLAYIWALLDEQGFNEHNKWIKKSQRLELKAWKHIRHTGAHAPSGRARNYYKEFNEFMESPDQGISGLKQNCKYTGDSIDLVDGMNYRFFNFVQNLIQTAIGHCANNNKPSDD